MTRLLEKVSYGQKYNMYGILYYENSVWERQGLVSICNVRIATSENVRFIYMVSLSTKLCQNQVRDDIRSCNDPHDALISSIQHMKRGLITEARNYLITDYTIFNFFLHLFCLFQNPKNIDFQIARNIRRSLKLQKLNNFMNTISIRGHEVVYRDNKRVKTHTIGDQSSGKGVLWPKT